MRSGRSAEPAGDASMAILLGAATRVLRALHTVAGIARPFAATCVVALPGSARNFLIAGSDHAAEMVL